MSPIFENGVLFGKSVAKKYFEKCILIAHYQMELDVSTI